MELWTDIKRLIRVRRAKNIMVKHLEEYYRQTIYTSPEWWLMSRRELQELRVSIRKDIEIEKSNYKYVKREIVNKWKAKLKLGK